MYLEELEEDCFDGDSGACEELEEIILDYVEDLLVESDVDNYDLEDVQELVEECLGGNWISCEEMERAIEEIYQGTPQYCEDSFYECLYVNEDIDTCIEEYQTCQND